MSDDNNTVTLATELTIAWLGNPNTRTNADDVPAFLSSMHAAVSGLAGTGETSAPEEAAQEYAPAVSVRKSLASKDHIVSMIDGKPYKALRRHLTGHGLTPDQYRARYNLKPDYPMVAEGYSQARRDLATKIGLGRKTGQKVVKALEGAAKSPCKTGKAALASARDTLAPRKLGNAPGRPAKASVAPG